MERATATLRITRTALEHAGRLADELRGLPRFDAAERAFPLTAADVARDALAIGLREIDLALGPHGTTDPGLLVERARALSEIEDS